MSGVFDSGGLIQVLWYIEIRELRKLNLTKLLCYAMFITVGYNFNVYDENVSDVLIFDNTPTPLVDPIK